MKGVNSQPFVIFLWVLSLRFAIPRCSPQRPESISYVLSESFWRLIQKYTSLIRLWIPRRAPILLPPSERSRIHSSEALSETLPNQPSEVLSKTLPNQLPRRSRRRSESAFRGALGDASEFCADFSAPHFGGVRSEDKTVLVPCLLHMCFLVRLHDGGKLLQTCIYVWHICFLVRPHDGGSCWKGHAKRCADKLKQHVLKLCVLCYLCICRLLAHSTPGEFVSFPTWTCAFGF